MGRLRRILEEKKGNIEMMRGHTLHVHAGRRKGGVMGVKRWLVVSDTGDSLLEEIDKHSLTKRTGLPARDLRVLDPLLSQPSSILGRERAIIVNLEHIKAIITATEVLMINSSNPFFLRFLQDLHARLPNSPNLKTSPLVPASMIQISNDMDTDHEAKPLLDEGSDMLPGGNVPRNSSSEDLFGDSPNVGLTVAKSAEDVLVESAPKQLPFEFRALEACIESACRCLESETKTLEDEAYPALDELTSQVSTLNLERVRQIKSRLVVLSGRVQKIADQLEHLLDDDNDMVEMYLTEKLDARLLEQASLNKLYDATFEDDNERDESISEKSYNLPKLDVEELEMLLEAYFVQINGTLQKLSSLSEYVDDTEDYINIMLDDKRNQLLQAAVIFDTLNVIINAGIVVVGLFGMNIQIELFDTTPRQFWATTGGTVGGCVALFLISLLWVKKRYLLLH